MRGTAVFFPGISGPGPEPEILDILLQNGGGIRCRAWAAPLIIDESGATIGMEARNPGGVLKISCSSCVVAAVHSAGEPEKLERSGKNLEIFNKYIDRILSDAVK